MWAIRKILRIPYTRHMWPILKSAISLVASVSLTLNWQKIAPLCMHCEDHHYSVASAVQKPPSDWKQLIGRPSHTWLHTIEVDLNPLNIILPLVCTEEEELEICGGHGNTQEECHEKNKITNWSKTAVTNWLLTYGAVQFRSVIVIQ